MCLVSEFVGETRREKERGGAVHGSVQAASCKLRNPFSLSLSFAMRKWERSKEEQYELTFGDSHHYSEFISPSQKPTLSVVSIVYLI